MSDLADFLRARAQDLEECATDYHDALRCGGFDRDGGFELKWCDCGYPARVLRQAGAMRKLITMICEANEASDAPDTIEITYYLAEGLLKTMAIVWCDHPDYDPAWNPQTAKPPPGPGRKPGGG